jgi:hypothetical protein
MSTFRPLKKSVPSKKPGTTVKTAEETNNRSGKTAVVKATKPVVKAPAAVEGIFCNRCHRIVRHTEHLKNADNS